MEPALGGRTDPTTLRERRRFVDGAPTRGARPDRAVALGAAWSLGRLQGVPTRQPGAEPDRSPPAPDPTDDGDGDGWRFDPFGSHEFRYFDAGEPTSWVATRGTVTEEVVVTLGELLEELVADQLRAASGSSALEGVIGGRAHRPFLTPDTEGPGTGGPGTGGPGPAVSTSRPLTSAERSAPRRAPRRSVVVACAAAVVALVTMAVAVGAAGTGSVGAPAARHPFRAPPPRPPSATADPAPADPTAAWWVDTAQPETDLLQADIETMSGQIGDPGALAAGCTAFAAHAETAASAPPAPKPTIEQEWRQTLATVVRIVDACASGNGSRLAEDLQPASLTIHDLAAQVASSLR